jgi:hypothetical protein
MHLKEIVKYDVHLEDYKLEVFNWTDLADFKMELNFRLAEFGAKILTRKCTEELKQTF